MNLRQAIELEARFQALLNPGDYTFVGPVNETQLNGYISLVQRIAKGDFFDKSIHKMLRQKDAVHAAASTATATTPFTVYAVVSPNKTGGDRLIYSEIGDYCRDNGIDRDLI